MNAGINSIRLTIEIFLCPVTQAKVTTTKAMEQQTGRIPLAFGFSFFLFRFLGLFCCFPCRLVVIGTAVSLLLALLEVAAAPPPRYG